MGVKFSQLPALATTAVAPNDYIAILDTDETILKRTSIDHASGTTAFGPADDTHFGHVKLSDGYMASGGDAASGIAASSAAVHSAYVAATAPATTATLGLVKPDNRTTEVDENGVISARGMAVEAQYDETTALYDHSIGDLIYVDSVLYKVTASIVAGQEVSEGTNVEVSDIDTAITPLYINDIPGAGGGGGGGTSSGHTILDPSGTEMPTESKLQFWGGANVTDDDTNGITKVQVKSHEIQDASGTALTYRPSFRIGTGLTATDSSATNTTILTPDTDVLAKQEELGTIELGDNALYAHALGETFIWKGQFVQVIDAIAPTEAISAKVTNTTVSDILAQLNSNLSNYVRGVSGRVSDSSTPAYISKHCDVVATQYSSANSNQIKQYSFPNGEKMWYIINYATSSYGSAIISTYSAGFIIMTLGNGTWRFVCIPA